MSIQIIVDQIICDFISLGLAFFLRVLVFGCQGGAHNVVSGQGRVDVIRGGSRRGGGRRRGLI